jgi:hypothetical protein
MRTKKKATIPISILIIPNSEWCPRIESVMAGGIHRESPHRESPRKGRGKSSSVTARESANATAGDMSHHLVQDPSFAISAAVTATAATATTVSKYAPAIASESIVGGDHQGDAQSTPIGGVNESKGSNNEGGRGNYDSVDDVADEDDDDGDGIDRYN